MGKHFKSLNNEHANKSDAQTKIDPVPYNVSDARLAH
jgi:hypothetical protein